MSIKCLSIAQPINWILREFGLCFYDFPLLEVYMVHKNAIGYNCMASVWFVDLKQ